MLSIVIPTHNRTDLLVASVMSVMRHAPPGTEIIVVDDASPQRSATQAMADFREVTVIRLKRQTGFAVAANTGIRASHGDFIEMLNDDTEVQPGWADAAIRQFENPQVGAVAPLVLRWPDGVIIDSAGDRYYLGGIASKRGNGSPIVSEYLQAQRVFGASGAAGFYRRSALDRVGLFPESFGSYFEDVDLAFRLNLAGFQTMYEPASRVLHHVSASYGRSERRLLERQSRNEELVFWRNVPRRMLWRALPNHAAVLIGKAHRRWHEGTLTPWLMGRLRIGVELGEILRHRRELSRWQKELLPGVVDEHFD